MEREKAHRDFNGNVIPNSEPMELNLFNEILQDLKGTGELRTSFIRDYKDVRGSNVGKVARNKGLKENAAIEIAERLADRYGRKVDLQIYRDVRAKAKIELKQAKRAIYEHFANVRWYETDNGKQRYTSMDELTIKQDSKYIAWIERLNAYHSLILESLHETYFVRIKD